MVEVEDRRGIGRAGERQGLEKRPTIRRSEPGDRDPEGGEPALFEDLETQPDQPAARLAREIDRQDLARPEAVLAIPRRIAAPEQEVAQPAETGAPVVVAIAPVPTIVTIVPPTALATVVVPTVVLAAVVVIVVGGPATTARRFPTGTPAAPRRTATRRAPAAGGSATRASPARGAVARRAAVVIVVVGPGDRFGPERGRGERGEQQARRDQGDERRAKLEGRSPRGRTPRCIPTRSAAENGRRARFGLPRFFPNVRRGRRE